MFACLFRGQSLSSLAVAVPILNCLARDKFSLYSSDVV